MISGHIKNHPRAVIPYVTAGLPSLDATGEIVAALADAGAAAIEIGIPFSDPTADGSVLQKASHMALCAGFRMDRLLGRLPSWSSAVDAPLVVMSYINPLMRRGLDDTLKALAGAGARGVIIPDLPRDASALHQICLGCGLDLVRFVSPATGEERVKEVVLRCGGFVYAVSVKGVTGRRSELPGGLRDQVGLVRRHTDLPVCVGFGISSASQVDEVLSYADGVIVGSHLMDRIMNAADAAGEAYDVLRCLCGTTAC